MGTISEEALQKRMDKRAEHIAMMQAELSRDRAKMQEKKKKAEDNRKIKNGGLVKIAALDEVDEGLLLGVLLDAAECLQVADAGTKRQWQTHGAQVLKEREQARANKRKGQPVAQALAVAPTGMAEQTERAGIVYSHGV